MTISKDTLTGMLISSFILGMLLATIIIFLGMAIRFRIEENIRKKNIESWLKEIEKEASSNDK